MSSLEIPTAVAKEIDKINLDKPRLKIYEEARVSGIQLTSLAWSHGLADAAWSCSCQTAAVSTRPCVSEFWSDYTAVCRTGEHWEAEGCSQCQAFANQPPTQAQEPIQDTLQT